MRTFPTGATRNNDENKLDFEGFLSPLALERFAEYMHQNRVQDDGTLRDSDNWQKGIPREQYIKSMWRHFFQVWKSYRNGNPTAEDLCALLFNVQGMLHEELKQEKKPKSVGVLGTFPETYDYQYNPNDLTPNGDNIQ